MDRPFLFLGFGHRRELGDSIASIGIEIIQRDIYIVLVLMLKVSVYGLYRYYKTITYFLILVSLTPLTFLSLPSKYKQIFS